MKRIGNYVKTVSEEKRITKKEIANRINCSEEQVEKWFKGDAIAMFWQLQEVADMLEITVDEILKKAD